MGYMTSGFEFQHAGEILWCHIRQRLQQILQFDEEWIIDTPRSETLWSETCQQNDIPRAVGANGKTARATEGPIGFTWWGWVLPQYVELAPTPEDGIWRLRASVEMGLVKPGSRDDVLDLAYVCQSFALGGALVLGDDDVLRMVFSIALDKSMAEEIAQFSAGLLHRQVAYAGCLATLFARADMISLVSNDHPIMGLRENPDEFVLNLFEGMPSARAILNTGHPAGPEGLCLTRAFSPELPALVEEAISWRYRPAIGEAGEAVFSNDAAEDPYTYFAYLPVENTQDLGKALTGDNFPFKTDPYLRIRMQIADSEPEQYATELDALSAANLSLWVTWLNASANILGCFCPQQSLTGFYIGQTFVLWPAAALPGPRDVTAWAETLSHLRTHVGDQSLNARLT
jgi:hypothetical protein